MHETLKSNSRLNTGTSSYDDEQHHCSRFHLASPKSVHVRKGDSAKSTASSQLPSTKLGLYKALQPLLKLASPSRPDGLAFIIFSCIILFYCTNSYYDKLIKLPNTTLLLYCCYCYYCFLFVFKYCVVC